MKNVDLAISSVTIPLPAAGKAQASKKKGAAKRSRSSSGPNVSADADSAPQPIVAEFAEMETEPVDSSTWLLHAALWFQPERGPSLPGWTGLAIERHHRIPSPDFSETETMAVDRPGMMDCACDVIKPDRRQSFPQSDLAPMGWDARSIARKEEGK